MRSSKEQQEQSKKERIICIYDNVFVECFGCRWLYELWLLLNISDSFKQAALQHWCFRKQAAADSRKGFWSWGKRSFLWPQGIISHNPVFTDFDHLFFHIDVVTFTVHSGCSLRSEPMTLVISPLIPMHFSIYFSSHSIFVIKISLCVFSLVLNYCSGTPAALGTTRKERMSPEVLWEK